MTISGRDLTPTGPMAFFHAGMIFSLFSEQIKEDVQSSCAKNLKKSEMREKKVELVGAKKSLSLYGGTFSYASFFNFEYFNRKFRWKTVIISFKNEIRYFNCQCSLSAVIKNVKFYFPPKDYF